MAFLEIKALSKKYDRALDYTIKGLDLNVEQGEFVTVLGKSGCGKTTLLRLLCGFEIPNSGEIILNEKIISSNAVWIPPEKRNIGLIFQEYALFPNMTVQENIAFAISSSQTNSKRIKEMLELTGLSEHRNKYPSQLSGGEQQRVAIARALSREPNILLLDEPFSNLDVELKELMREEIPKMLRKIKTTAIFVTHDQIDALSISNRIAILHDGRIQQIDTPYKIYNEPANTFVAEFLGKVNMFDGIVESPNTILSDIGNIPINNNTTYPEGTVVKFMIRPEDAAVSRNGSIAGIVEKYIYQGANYSVMLSVNTNNNKSLSLLILLPGIDKIEIGQEIRFNLFIRSKYYIFNTTR